MKEELIIGAWYKSKYNNYFKFEKTENDWNYYYSERIINNIWGGPGRRQARFFFWQLEDLTEIQSFLPPNHPDLFTNKPIQNENLDYLIPLLTELNTT